MGMKTNLNKETAVNKRRVMYAFNIPSGVTPILQLYLFWGNSYSSTTQSWFILQKRAMRVMTFSKFHEHPSPIFNHLNIVKLPDLVFLYIAALISKFTNSLSTICA